MQGYILAVSLEIVQTWLFSSGSAPWSAALRTCPTNSIIPRCFFEMCADNASRFCSIPFLPLKETPFLTAKSAKKDPEAEGSADLKLRMNCGSTYEANVTPRDDVSVTRHGLKIPVDALNYAEFSVRMKTCEQEFKSALIF